MTDEEIHMFTLMIELFRAIRRLVSERDEQQIHDTPESDGKKHRRGPIEWVIDTLGDALISAGTRLKSWYAEAENRSYVPVIHIE